MIDNPFVMAVGASIAIFGFYTTVIYPDLEYKGGERNRELSEELAAENISKWRKIEKNSEEKSQMLFCHKKVALSERLL